MAAFEPPQADEIHVLQAAGFIKFLLELGNEFFDFHD